MGLLALKDIAKKKSVSILLSKNGIDQRQSSRGNHDRREGCSDGANPFERHNGNCAISQKDKVYLFQPSFQFISPANSNHTTYIECLLVANRAENSSERPGCDAFSDRRKMKGAENVSPIV
jgi:hypothetical protein